MKKFSILTLATCSTVALFTIAFTACDSGSSSSSSEEFEISAASVDELDSCTSKMQGETAYVKDEKTMYVCEDGKWTVCTDCDTAGDMVASSSSTPRNDKLSSSTPRNDEKSSHYVCDIYTLTDAVNCECNEDREDSLAYNYDSKAELVCIFDEYLNKWGWVENKKDADEGEDLSSGGKGKSSSSAKATPDNDKGGEGVKSSSSSKGEGNLGYDHIWNTYKDTFSYDCLGEEQNGDKVLAAYADSCIYVCFFDDSLDRWMWHKIDGTCPEKVESSSSKEKSSSSSAKSSSTEIVIDESRLCTPGYSYCNRSLGADSVQAGAYKKFTDERNGRTYYYLTINGTDQNKKRASVTVMAENLNIGEMVEGGKDQSDDSKIERYCYNNDTLNCLNYGGLYEWAEMMQLPSECNTKSCADQIKPNHQGICPDGWHLLTYDEFYTVVKADGNDAGVEGVRAQGFGGHNYSGYGLIGAGLWEDGFYLLSETAFWFYPEENVDNVRRAFSTTVSSFGSSHSYSPSTKTNGSSVRCVMNK